MKFGNLVKTGFGAGIGLAGAQMIFIAIGLALLLWGMSLLKKAERRGESKTTAYIVMALGVVVGLGLGAGFLLENAMNNF